MKFFSIMIFTFNPCLIKVPKYYFLEVSIRFLKIKPNLLASHQKVYIWDQPLQLNLLYLKA